MPSRVGPLAWQATAALFANKPRALPPIEDAAFAAAAEDVAAARTAAAVAAAPPSLLVLNTLGRYVNDEATAMLRKEDRAWTQGIGMMSYPNWCAK